MDERIDIWDADGKPTGQTALKSEAHRQGWWHPTVHIWFYTGTAQVLLQRRAAVKETFPGLWDVSVAGHIGAGEDSVAAALREIREEIGLDVSASELEAAGLYPEARDHPGGIRDREYHHLYFCRLPVSVESLVPQPGEVDDLRLFPLLQLAEEIMGLANPAPYVPHAPAYYARVFREIRERSSRGGAGLA